MNTGQLRRFDRWRRNLPENTAYFVSRIVDDIVPAFLEQGFGRYSDYAGGSTYAVGANCIPLQRRAGIEWPTVEILFDRKYRPSIGVNFALLPEGCVRPELNGDKAIPRMEANVVEGPAFFSLCKGCHKNFDCNFGCTGFVLRPRNRIDREIEQLQSLLPWLFDCFEHEILKSWYDRSPGYVAKHAFLSRASQTFSKLRHQ